MAKPAKLDPKIMEALAEVARRKAEIGRAEKPDWKTNCLFVYEEGVLGKGINLHTVTQLETLINIGAFVIIRAEHFDKARVALGVESADTFRWNGFTLADWLWDLKQRATKIQIEAKKKHLAALESRLNSLVSPEKRAELELAAVMAELKEKTSA